MKKMKLQNLDEVIYKDTCSNGLEIYVWQNKKVNTFKGAYVVKTGAENINFKMGKKEVSVPYGTHHYLEHMMCKKEDGTSLLDDFNKLGCYSNAATYPDKTIYEFVGSVNLKENLELLLDAMYDKKFLEESFESERGPILEEARMRADDANRIALYGINNCLFSKYTNRVTGLGNIEDIENMKLENLETIYNAFYHPKNSFIVVTGNVDPKSVIEQIKANQAKKTFPKYLSPIKEIPEEPRKVVKEEETKYANIETPRVYISVKIPKSRFELDEVLLLNIVNVVLNSNFGVTSLLREKLLEENLIITLGASAYIEKDYLIIQVSSKTNCPKEVLPYFLETLENLELKEEDITRKIKSEIANLVLSYEDPDNVNDMLAYCLVRYGHIIENEKEILESIDQKKIKEVFKKISMKQKNIFYLLPKKNET